MPIKFNCPSCFKPVSAPDDLAGKEALCPTCKARVSVPLPSEPVNAIMVDDEGAPPHDARPAGTRAAAQGTAGGEYPRQFRQDTYREKSSGVPIWVFICAGAGLLLLVVFGIAIVAAIAIPSLLKSRIAANETSAAGTLKNMVTTEATWRQNDTDRNGTMDYWTGDVSGFYRVLDGSGNCVKIMDIAVAKADNAPLPADADDVAPDIFSSVSGGMPTAKSGYYFQSMTTDATGKPYQTDGPDADKNAWENPADFGFQANPDRYNSSGINIFIVDGNGIIWKKDKGNACPVLTWPADDPSLDGWKKLE